MRVYLWVGGLSFMSVTLKSMSPNPAEHMNSVARSQEPLESKGKQRSFLFKGKFQGEEHYRGMVPEIAGWWPIRLVKKDPWCLWSQDETILWN